MKATRRSAEATMAGADDERLFYNEAAEFLGVSRTTLERMVQRGELRSFRIGAKVTFSKRDLRAVLVAAERPAAAR